MHWLHWLFSSSVCAHQLTGLTGCQPRIYASRICRVMLNVRAERWHQPWVRFEDACKKLTYMTAADVVQIEHEVAGGSRRNQVSIRQSKARAERVPHLLLPSSHGPHAHDRKERMRR